MSQGGKPRFFGPSSNTVAGFSLAFPGCVPSCVPFIRPRPSSAGLSRARLKAARAGQWGCTGREPVWAGGRNARGTSEEGAKIALEAGAGRHCCAPLRPGPHCPLRPRVSHAGPASPHNRWLCPGRKSTGPETSLANLPGPDTFRARPSTQQTWEQSRNGRLC